MGPPRLGGWPLFNCRSGPFLIVAQHGHLGVFGSPRRTIGTGRFLHFLSALTILRDYICKASLNSKAGGT